MHGVSKSSKARTRPLESETQKKGANSLNEREKGGEPGGGNGGGG